MVWREELVFVWSVYYASNLYSQVWNSKEFSAFACVAEGKWELSIWIHSTLYTVHCILQKFSTKVYVSTKLYDVPVQCFKRNDTTPYYAIKMLYLGWWLSHGSVNHNGTPMRLLVCRLLKKTKLYNIGSGYSGNSPVYLWAPMHHLSAKYSAHSHNLP